MADPVAQVGADADTLASLSGTLAHIALLKRKQERLLATQIEAERQFVHRAACSFKEGSIGEIELAGAYLDYERLAAPGYEKRWNEAVPVPAKRMQYIRRNAPNGLNGSWHGPYPIYDAPAPVDGISVVYVLYDETNVPCYVGSTHALRDRFKRHSRDGKNFVRWSAFPCADREAAFQMEERLLAEHQPYLNKKRYR